MDNWQAQNRFWNSFTWAAYDDQAAIVEGDAPSAYPHITYESADGTFGTQTTLSVHLWNRSQSWADIKRKASEIKEALSGGGVKLDTDTGQIWLTIPEGTPFARPFPSGAEDELVQRIMLTVSVQFLSD